MLAKYHSDSHTVEIVHEGIYYFNETYSDTADDYVPEQTSDWLGDDAYGINVHRAPGSVASLQISISGNDQYNDGEGLDRVYIPIPTLLRALEHYGVILT